jgi:lysophospholipase L1-like esterase
MSLMKPIFWLAVLNLSCKANISAPSATWAVHGESVVLAGTGPTRLLGREIDLSSVTVTNRYDDGSITYEPGRDYTIDPAEGTIRRTANSRLPDFSTNVLYGKTDFDHTLYPGYGNTAYFGWVSYRCAWLPKLVTPSDQSSRVNKTIQKLRRGGEFRIVAFGDSIMAGGEASRVDLQFPVRFADYLQRKYPAAIIKLENGATGGDTSAMGLARLNEKVLSRGPDLVLIGFGMNDHNLPAVGGVDADTFRDNLVSMVRQVQARTDADVILLSAFPPNPQWKFGTAQMPRFAQATRAAAELTGSAYADVHAVWSVVLTRKDPSGLLANNINHPNDFGHWLYLQALEGIGL